MRRLVPSSRSRLLAPALLLGISLGCEAPPTIEPPPPTWEVAAPMPPSPVVLACPDGYRVSPLPGGGSVCDPWAGDRPSCADDELLIPGVGCEPISDCAPRPLRAGQAWVRADAPAGGDGSAERPYATIYEAFGRGARDVLLAEGSHAFARAVSGMTIEGRCPAMTELVLGGALILSDVTIRGVHITGPIGTNLAVRFGTTVTLEEVRMTGLDRAIEVGGTLVAHRVRIDDGDVAILGFDATAIELDHVLFEGLEQLALYGDRSAGRPGTSVTLRDVVVIDGGNDPGTGQFQLDVGALLAERVVIEDCVSIGINARSDTATVRDLVVRRTAGLGLGLLVGDAEVSSVYTADTVGGVLFAEGEASAIGLVIERSGDVGLAAEDATLDVRDVVIATSMSAGVSLGASTVRLENLSVTNVTPRPDRPGTGAGLLAERASELTLERVHIREVHTYGLGAYGSSITASDVTIQQVHGDDDDAGYGAVGVLGSRLLLMRTDVAGAETVGLLVEDSSAEVTDLRIDAVRAIDGANGIGIQVSGHEISASLVLDRAVVTDTVRWGLLTSRLATVSATHVDVIGVSASPCAATLCPDTSGGAAFIAHDGASLELSDFRAEGAAFAGLVATAGVHAVLARGTIEGNGVGLVVSPALSVNLGTSPGLDLVEVTLVDNGVEQQTTEVRVEAPDFDPE